MRFRYQRGHSILIVIVILPGFAIFSLNSLHYQLDKALAITGDERRYLQAYNQALSALDLALAYTWDISPLLNPSKPTLKNSWHCEIQSEQKFTACIKLITMQVYLIKGKSEALPDKSTMAIYQRVKLENKMWGVKRKMIAIDGGMLDFCPEKSEKFCDEN